MKVLIVDGHPDSESYGRALADAYEEGARSGGAEVQRRNIRDLRFDPVLHRGYREIQELEEDLTEMQQTIEWCQHFAFVCPIWWGGLPALTKGFIDRTFLPGWAFRYHDNDPFWDGLLKGRSARLILTSDAPDLFNRLVYLDSPARSIKNLIFWFCGFKPLKTTRIGNVKNMSESSRHKRLEEVRRIARG